MSQPEDQRSREADVDSQADEALSVEAQLDQARSVADEYRRKADVNLDLAQRAMADFANYKRRTALEPTRRSATPTAAC